MRIRPPTPSGIAIGVALVVVLTAGAAAGQALITSADIKDNTIQSVDIKGETIVSGDIKNGTITSSDIKDATVSSGDIKNETVASGDIKNETIASGDIKNGTIASSDVKDNSLAAGDLAANSVGSSELASNAVTNAKIAANAVNSAKIGDGTVTSADIADGTVAEADVDPDLLASLGGYDGPNWGIVDRNVIAHGDSYLRAGPVVLDEDLIRAGPPAGIGSLGLRTGTGEDAAAFGNQVDFFGELLSDITTLEFSVFTTIENNDEAPTNMPSLSFEVNPNLAVNPGVVFSTLVLVLDNTTPGVWSTVDVTSDTALWGFTGTAGQITGCDLNLALCTWDEVMTAINDGGDEAFIYTVQFTKGRNWPFSGAVDALTINDTTYDFEPTGVTETPAG